MADARKIDPKSGFCSVTRIYHNLRPPAPLPPLSQPISITEYAISLLRATTSSPTSTTSPSTPFLIDCSTGCQLSYSQFFSQVHSLSTFLLTQYPSLSQNDVAFILCPPSLHVPVLYFSLLSLGLTVSPANPLSSPSELTHLLQLSKPAVVFTISSLYQKFPKALKSSMIFVDKPQFQSVLSNHTSTEKIEAVSKYSGRVIHQNDSAAILYSSGTTGRVKGVELSHRTLIAVIAGLYHNKHKADGEDENPPHPVSLFSLPLFHVFGFFMLIRAAALGETLVLLGKFDFENMLEAIERYKVTYMPVAPPLVVAFAKSDIVNKYDLSSLRLLGCGGAPLGKEVSESFTARFPNVEISQGYGMTETGGAATRMIGTEEIKKHGSTGRLAEHTEAKIVDPDTKEALPPGQRGELWLRGPIIMKGYVGDSQATAETWDSEGWLKTGDLCYFDSDGFLYIVDRLKELIKYKAYQVPPAELEHLLQSIPEVADAAVIPYPDEEAGQIPMAFIVRKPGSHVTETQIMDIVAKQVAPYKKIRRVAFISSIPKSPAGKILRRELVNHAISAASSKL
ncbi:4-coumarate--CoA ligase-like 9 [Coffea eugenioides]|uniref:4-coumarate--CoA ligase-like 9 n=1 Tax=Coffea eugenioides TaxID=49369 RepID=UPI000F611D66|nr:4-coumarate--CoA ligase-like 9 [Coffea eugenioides]